MPIKPTPAWHRFGERKVFRSRVSAFALLSLLILRLLFGISSDSGFYLDFINFYNAGKRIVVGEKENLYRTEALIAGQVPHGNPKIDRFGYTGFPLSAILFAPLGLLDPRSALVAFKLSCTCAFLAGMAILFKVVWEPDARLRGPVGFGFLLTILLFEPFWGTLYAGGQSTPLAFLFLALFLWNAQRSLEGWAAVCLFTAILVKPILAPVLIAFLVSRAWRMLFRVSAFGVAAGVFSFVWFGVQVHREWLERVTQEGDRWAVPWWNNASLFSMFSNFWIYLRGEPAFGLTPMPGDLRVLQIFLRIALLVLFVWLALRVSHKEFDNSNPDFLISLGIVFSLALSNVVWPNYLVFLAIPLMVLGKYFVTAPRTGQWLLGLAAFSVLHTNPWPLHRMLRDAFRVNSIPEVIAVSMFTSSTLLLTLLAVVVFLKASPHLPASPYAAKKTGAS